MDTGREFLQAQVNNAIVQHELLLDAVRDHVKQADDRRFRELCERHLPTLESHQNRLEAYGESIGAKGRTGLKGALGSVLGKAREAVDSLRETDFLRLVADIVAIRQAQDTFATFAAAGERCGDDRLAEVGRASAQDHETMQREFNQLCVDMFVEHVRATGQAAPSRAV